MNLILTPFRFQISSAKITFFYLRSGNVYRPVCPTASGNWSPVAARLQFSVPTEQSARSNSDTITVWRTSRTNWPLLDECDQFERFSDFKRLRSGQFAIELDQNCAIQKCGFRSKKSEVLNKCLHFKLLKEQHSLPKQA